MGNWLSFYLFIWKALIKDIFFSKFYDDNNSNTGVVDIKIPICIIILELKID